MPVRNLFASLKEKPAPAVAVVCVGALAGMAMLLGEGRTRLPSVWAFILSAEAGAVVLSAVFLALSALFTLLPRADARTVLKTQALAHLAFILYLPAGLNVVLNIRGFGKYMGAAAAGLFLAAQVCVLVYLLSPRKIRLAASWLIFVGVAFFITTSIKNTLPLDTGYGRDREEIPLGHKPAAFSGPWGKGVYVNAGGQWRPATAVKPPHVYRFFTRLDKPSRLSMGFLAASPEAPGEARVQIRSAGPETEKVIVKWEEAGWKDFAFDKILPPGDVELKIAPESGPMWVSDPVFAPKDAGGPNLVFIVIDTLRADRMSCYGYPRRTTPQIDKVAVRGVLYERHYSPSSWSTAAMASLFTGLYPRQHGCIDFASLTLPSEFETLPEALKKQGYRTVGVSGNPLLSVKTGFAQGFDRFDEACFEKVNYRSGECMTDRALSALGEGEPFALYLQYMDPHMPYLAPPPYLMKFRGRPYPGSPGTVAQFLGNRYDEMVSYADAQVGRLLGELDRRGMLRRAIVVITADHGEELGDHGGYNHGYTAYNEVAHVPLIISGPGLPEGKRVKRLTGGVDLFVTFAGKDEKTMPDRESLVAFDKQPRRWALTDAMEQTALITPRYKFIADVLGGKRMLFDLENDPFESRNLADEEPELARRAHRKLEQILEQLDEVKPPRKRSRKLMKEMRGRLRALGYVQ